MFSNLILKNRHSCMIIEKIHLSKSQCHCFMTRTHSLMLLAQMRSSLCLSHRAYDCLWVCVGVSDWLLPGYRVRVTVHAGQMWTTLKTAAASSFSRPVKHRSKGKSVWECDRSLTRGGLWSVCVCVCCSVTRGGVTWYNMWWEIVMLETWECRKALSAVLTWL